MSSWNEPIGYRTAKWLLAGFIAMGLVTVAVTMALAAGPVTRLGTEYSGMAPTHCSFGPDEQHPTDLSVDCRHSDGNARIRYRMLKDVGGLRDNAEVSADISTWVGEDCTVTWQSAPKQAARTVRVLVPAGSYCDIHSITWSQP